MRPLGNISPFFMILFNLTSYPSLPRHTKVLSDVDYTGLSYAVWVLGLHILFFSKETENLGKFNHYIAIILLDRFQPFQLMQGWYMCKPKYIFSSKEKTIKSNNMKNRFLLESHSLNLHKKGLLSHSSKHWNSEITNSFIIIAGNNFMLTLL